MKPIVAVVGRPNVGKSTLFNRLVEQRIAIIEAQPGITRDRIYADSHWAGRTFTLVDTGGITAGGGDIEAAVRHQAELAMAEADVVVFVLDVTGGITPEDQDVAALLRRRQKPVVLVVNKVDNPERETAVAEFWRLGLGEPVGVSAVHGRGTGDLLDAVVAALPPATAAEDQADDRIKVAVVGRPNVGKSSLVNALLGQERMIVAAVAGTTRDAVDVELTSDGQRYLLIDTAGMRRRARVAAGVERYSVLRALRAIDRSDVVLLVIDGTVGVTEQDKKIAGYIHEAGKALVIVVNKWDIVARDDKTMQRMHKQMQSELAFVPYALYVFVSALTRARLHKLLPEVQRAAANHARRVTTATLNDSLAEAILLTPPPSDKGRRLKIYYATQPDARPPTLLLFVNDPELCHFSYLRYLENQVRAAFDFAGTPVRLVLRRRNSADAG